MKVKDLIELDIDVDVYDNICEELSIAFVGPMSLTDEGRRNFADVLEYGVDLDDGVAIVNCDAADDAWGRRLRKAKEFFRAAAGYCSVEDYEKWFKEEYE